MPVASLLVVPLPGQIETVRHLLATIPAHEVVDEVDDTLVVLCDDPDRRRMDAAWEAVEAHPAVASVTLAYFAPDHEDVT